MALSEEEQRLLDELAASLAAEDPRLASRLGTTPVRKPVRKTWMAGIGGFIVGVVLLVLGMRLFWPLSVAGYLVMFGTVFFMVWSARRPIPTVPTPPSAADPGLINKLEDRWNRRQQEGR